MTKPRILYLEMLENNFGNKRLDIEIINSLCEFADITVCGPLNWYPEFKSEVQFEELKVGECPKVLRRILGRYWNPYQSLRNAGRLDKKNKYDYIIFASYHPYVSVFMPLIIKNMDKVYAMNHNNIDYIDASLKGRRFFSLYGRKIHHIVFEKFIADYLIQTYRVAPDNVHVIPHPMNTIYDKYPVKYNCVGISNSNDEQWIDKLVRFEEQTKTFLKKGLKVVIRSKNLTYDNGALIVIKGYLQDEEYYNYICSSEYIFMAFPESFRYRMSGTIVDALSNRIPVIGTDIPLIKYYSNEYSDIVFCVKEPNDLVKILVDRNQGEVDTPYDKFIEKHSYKFITKSLMKMLGV